MSEKDAAVLEIVPDTALILPAHETDDDVGKILRVQLVIERQVEQLIQLRSLAVVNRRTNYYTKVNLLRAMDVPEKICVACDAIGDIRNQFAHNPKATIANTRSLVDRYLNAVAEFCPILPKAHGKFVRKETGAVYEFEYSKAAVAQQLVVAASFMSAVLGVLPRTHRFGSIQLVKVTGFDL